MSDSDWIDRGRLEIRLATYATGSATCLADPTVLPQVQDYRRRIGGQMVPLDRLGIRQRIPASDYHVSRKVDGEFTVAVFRNGEAFTLNPGGTLRVGLPLLSEFAKHLQLAGVSQAMVAGELYAETNGRRSRVHDIVSLARQPQTPDDLDRIRLAVFDLISLNGGPIESDYKSTWQTLSRWFSDGTLVHPVETKLLKQPADIESTFDQWVDGQGAEGLVVRSDDAGWFKVKPRYTIDAVVVGYTESSDDRAGMIHDLLVAIMRADGTFHVLTRVGGGFSEEQRRHLLSDLRDRIVESEYVEVNSDHVAYKMVRPELILELSCLDMISQNTRGGPVNRMVLDYVSESTAGYKVVRRLPLASIISPQFLRLRDDKKVHSADIGIAQISNRIEVQQQDADARDYAMPTTQMLRREVFTKQLKGETMVRKFVLLQTNKQSLSDEFPAFVIHYTDFSPNRKEPLSREVYVSNSSEQIELMYSTLKSEYIKKGWTPHSGVVLPSFPVEMGASSKSPVESQSVDIASSRAVASVPCASSAATDSGFAMQVADHVAVPETPVKPKRAPRKKPKAD